MCQTKRPKQASHSGYGTLSSAFSLGNPGPAFRGEGEPSGSLSPENPAAGDQIKELAL